MGIKKLSEFLRDNFPSVYTRTHISEFKYEIVAIDTSLYLCRYKAAYGEEGWLQAFIRLISSLRENEIHCVFIYDTGSPPEKQAEQKERSDAREKTEERISLLEEALAKFHMENEVDPILLEFQAKKGIAPVKNLLRKTSESSLNIPSLEYHIGKMRKNAFKIDKKDFDLTKKLFDILEVPYFDAPLEAETMCSDLCIRGKVKAVLSEDTDVLAYGSPIFLSKISSDGSCLKIHYEDLLKKTSLTASQFLDFCIMCGTDYNKNIPRIGPARAYKLISEFGSIEKIAAYTGLDISILNHIRVRELFRGYKKPDVKVGYCGFPDISALQVFLFQKGLKYDTDTLKKSFFRNSIVLLEEDEIILEEDGRKTSPLGVPSTPGNISLSEFEIEAGDSTLGKNITPSTSSERE